MSAEEVRRIEQSNEVAGIVIDQMSAVHPGRYADVALRYAIADALWAAGYRKVATEEEQADV